MFKQNRTDEEIIMKLIDLAKTNHKAMKLLVELENSGEFGQADMLINKIHNFVEETEKLPN